MASWGDDAPILKRGPAPAGKAGSWGDDAVAIQKPRKTSQALGFMEGAFPAFDKVNRLGNPLDYLADAAGLDQLDSRNESARLAEKVKGQFREAEKTQRPGMTGKIAGNIVSTIPAAVATKNPLILGGLQGGLSSEHDDLGGIAGDAFWGALANKAGGAVIDKVSDLAAPVIRPAVEKLRQAGVRLTPGQIRGGKAMIREDKAMSRPVIGERIAADRTQGLEDFNRGAVNRAMLPLGARLPDSIATGHDAVAFMQDAAGKAFDNIMPKLTLKADARLAAGMRNGWKVAQDLPPELQQRFLSTVNERLRFDASGTLQGRTLAAGVRSVKKLASEFGKSGDPDQRILGEALSHIDDGLHSALASQNPGYAKALDAANKAYKGNIIVSNAAKGADDGVFGTGALKTAVRQADRTKNQRATAAGRAHMQDYANAGRDVLPSKTPDSGTAGRTMDGSWIQRGRGAIDAGLYEADKALMGLRTAPRPQVLKDIARFLKDHRAEGAFAGGGLLSGLLRDD